MKAVDTSFLPNCDKHPPFRELMKHKHKAYANVVTDTLGEIDPLAAWVVRNISYARDVMTFMLVPIRTRVEQHLTTAADSWWFSE